MSKNIKEVYTLLKQPVMDSNLEATQIKETDSFGSSTLKTTDQGPCNSNTSLPRSLRIYRFQIYLIPSIVWWGSCWLRRAEGGRQTAMWAVQWRRQGGRVNTKGQLTDLSTTTLNPRVCKSWYRLQPGKISTNWESSCCKSESKHDTRVFDWQRDWLRT